MGNYTGEDVEAVRVKVQTHKQALQSAAEIIDKRIRKQAQALCSE